ncbi:MAG TPA: DNA polymerase Y family protein [Chromatiales bacterium]|nr:DNA polymerase Y family protein [Chromatiales bacterium]
MRWLAIHLPDLPLEVHSRGIDPAIPLAVSGRRDGVRILYSNLAARRMGVVPSLRVEAARALAGGLRVRTRSSVAERHALRRLACWAGQFSPVVSLESPFALVLEAGGSLRLFKGEEGLLGAVREGLDRLGYEGRLCLAPTAGAALLLAAWEGAPMCVPDEGLHRAIGDLPLAALTLDEQSSALLKDMGVRRIGELLGLPRAGVAQRLGPELLLRLERILGRAPDPRPVFEPPVRFTTRLELPAEVESLEGILFAARRVLGELEGFLRLRQAGARRLEWRLVHQDLPVTRFGLGMASPERDARRLFDLLRERLERLELPAPVRGIGLQAGQTEPLAGRPRPLFAQQQNTGVPEEEARLLDRLRSRLGEAQVKGLRGVADHRPERGWAYCDPQWRGDHSAPRAGRPCWLMAEPQPLEMRRGGLTFEGERERIEVGWWDGRPVVRDYFVVRTPQGERLWVFREAQDERRWFLHGVF